MLTGCDPGEPAVEGAAKLDLGARRAAGGGSPSAPDDGSPAHDGAEGGAAVPGSDDAASAGDDGGDAAGDEGWVRLSIGKDTPAEWKTEKARARVIEGRRRKLEISARAFKHVGSSTKGGRLVLTAFDYSGPGEYELKGPNSTLAGIQIDHGGAKKADRDADRAGADKKMTKAMKAGIVKGAKSTIVFMHAKLVITSATDDFVDGTLTWSGVTTSSATSVTGTFHARLEAD